MSGGLGHQKEWLLVFTLGEHWLYPNPLFLYSLAFVLFA